MTLVTGVPGTTDRGTTNRERDDVFDAVFTLWDRFRPVVPAPDERSRNEERGIVPVPR
jgi:hypothetical protein